MGRLGRGEFSTSFIFSRNGRQRIQFTSRGCNKQHLLNGSKPRNGIRHNTSAADKKKALRHDEVISPYSNIKDDRELFVALQDKDIFAKLQEDLAKQHEDMIKTSLEELRKDSDQILYLPKKAQQVVDAYLHIRVGGAVAASPYHINPGLRGTNRAALGKGTPAEIEALAAKYFKQYDMHVQGTEQLRTFLVCCGIGIDCSGFASWVLNEVTQASLGRPIWKCLRFPGIRRSVISKARPVQNISANLLTGLINSDPITDLGEVRPGDLLRVAGWHHVVVITEVGTDKAGRAYYFQYAQSSCMYGSESGVRTGYAIIKLPKEPLLAQQWHDSSETGVLKELIAEGGADSRAVRLKALSGSDPNIAG